MSDIDNPEEPNAFKLRARYAMLPAWAFERLADQPAEVSRFYWWLCLSVVASEGREGYKRISEMATALGVGESTVRRWVDILKKAGVITVERYKRKNGQYGQNVYACPMDCPPPMPEASAHPASAHHVSGGSDQGESSTSAHHVSGGQRSPRERSINQENNSSTYTAEPLRGSPAAAAPRAEQTALVLADDGVLDAMIVDEHGNPIEGHLLPVPGAPNAGVITREWVDYCGRGGVKLTNQTIKRYAKAIKEALDEQFPEAVIRAALTQMARDRVIARVSLFPTYLIRVQTGPELPPQRLTQAEASRVRLEQQTGVKTDLAAFLAEDIPMPEVLK